MSTTGTETNDRVIRKVIHGGIRLEAMSQDELDIFAEQLGVNIFEYQARPKNAGWYGYGVLVRKHRPQPRTEYRRNYERS
jgi:hypothetical protein